MTATDLREFHAGDILFREGDPGDAVLRLVSGIVEIQRDVGGRPIVLGHVNEGEFIGEMGAIESRPRIATARAETEGVVEVLSVAQFFDRISSDPNSALELILRLSARLRNADDELIRHGSPSQPLARVVPTAPQAPAVIASVPAEASQVEPSIVTISADTPTLQEQLGSAPIEIVERPFVIGRELEAGESWPEYTPQIALKASRPYLISRNHFMIDRRPGHLIVRDLDSKHGTSVNGQPIGRHFGKDWAQLDPGVNRIVAGGRGSEFQFSVTVA